VTRADIEAHEAKLLASASASASAAATSSNVVVTDDDLPIEENINRLRVDGFEARSVVEAIKLLRY